MPLFVMNPPTITMEPDDGWLDTQQHVPQTSPFDPVTITRADMDAAVTLGIVTRVQAEVLWHRWAGRVVASGAAERREVQATDARTRFGLGLGRPVASGPGFGFVPVLYYLGGLVAIAAMTLFLTRGWSLWGPWGMTAIASIYMAGALGIASGLKRRGWGTPAGVLATLAVCLVPMVIWGVQNGLGLWPAGGAGLDDYRAYHTHINWRWLFIELGTLAAAVVLLWVYKRPFMVMPVAMTVWYLSMDVSHALMQREGLDWILLRDVTLLFGLGTCALAVWVEVRTRLSTNPEWRQDHAFWLYVVGALMAWSGLSLRESASEWSKLGYGLINLGWVLVGAAIGRRVFTVLGALGVAAYLGYLSHRVFAHTAWFPLVLSLLGLGVVGLGIVWQKHEQRIHDRLAMWLPKALKH
jgi:hypothetical protein